MHAWRAVKGCYAVQLIQGPLLSTHTTALIWCRPQTQWTLHFLSRVPALLPNPASLYQCRSCWVIQLHPAREPRQLVQLTDERPYCAPATATHHWFSQDAFMDLMSTARGRTAPQFLITFKASVTAYHVTKASSDTKKSTTVAVAAAVDILRHPHSSRYPCCSVSGRQQDDSRAELPLSEDYCLKRGIWQ